ncbi:hypothetical protein Tco_1517839 [Tanacetum coccineum]
MLPFSSTSMASTQASSSNPSKKIKLTIIPPRQLFVDITSKEDDTTTPSPITKSSSSSPPNAPSKTPSTKDTSSTFVTTSSLFESKPQSSTPSSNETPSPQPSNPFLDDIMDAPPRPSNPLPLQSHHFLDITISLSPNTPLDHILDTPSPSSAQLPPQPPLMGHPIYFNMFDYHGVCSSETGTSFNSHPKGPGFEPGYGQVMQLFPLPRQQPRGCYVPARVDGSDTESVRGIKKQPFQVCLWTNTLKYTAEDDLEVFSTDDLGLDWIYAHNFLTCLQRLSSYTSGHCEVSESAACLEKASFSCTSGHVEVS